MIWLFLILAALIPALLLFHRRDQAEAFDPLAHYRAQLAEVAEDESRGIIDPESARAARLEVERRILKVADRAERTASGKEDHRLVAGVALLLVAGSFVLYWVLGRPDLPAKPGFVVSAMDQPVQEGGPTYREAIDQVKSHLEDNPRDVEGWRVLAASSRSARDFSAAANAFEQLAELEPSNTSHRLNQFQAMFMMSGGQISPAARLVLVDFIQSEPDHPAGQYYAGVLMLQNGDETGAKATWLALAARSDANAPWMPRLRAQLERLGAGLPQVSQDQMDAVAAMEPEERAAFVRSMMERLAARLEESPDDPQGWLMLARSHLSVGDRDAAIASLERGLAVVSEAGKPPLRALLDNLLSQPDL